MGKMSPLSLGRWDWTGHRTNERAPIPTWMLGIVNKCHVGLLVSKQHPCVGNESEGNFSSGYVLMSFQTLKSSSGQPKLTALFETRPSLPGQTGENPPYKGSWLKIGYSQEERDELEYPKLRISSQVILSFAALPIERVRRSSSESNLRPWVVLDTQVWLTARDWNVEKLPLLNEFMLSPKGERRTTALGEIGDWLTLGGHRMKLNRTCMTQPILLLTWDEFTKDADGSRGFLSKEIISFNLIPCIITFGL